MLKRNTLRSIITTTAISLSLVGAAVAAPNVADAPLPFEGDAAVEQAAKKKKKPRILLEAIELGPGADGNPQSGINPCVKVWRQIYKRNLVNGRFSLRFNFTYSSGGQLVTQEHTVPLSDTTFLGNDSEKKRYVRVDAHIDVLDAPVDAGTDVTGTVQLVKAPAVPPNACAADDAAGAAGVSL